MNSQHSIYLSMSSIFGPLHYTSVAVAYRMQNEKRKPHCCKNRNHNLIYHFLIFACISSLFLFSLIFPQAGFELCLGILECAFSSSVFFAMNWSLFVSGSCKLLFPALSSSILIAFKLTESATYKASKVSFHLKCLLLSSSW